MNKQTCPEIRYFGANYPDAGCIDGMLHDLDNCDENGNLYRMDEEHPCPFCNREKFIEHHLTFHSREYIDGWIETLEQKHKFSLKS